MKLHESAVVPDLKHQPLLRPPPPADTTTADPKLTVCSPQCKLAHAADASPETFPVTFRTLALVTATLGLAFAVDLVLDARGEYPILAAVAASFMIFCASSSLYAWCQGPVLQEPPLRTTAAARVLFWSFAMALVVSMTCSVADRPRKPRPAGLAVSVLGLVISWMCLAEIRRSSVANILGNRCSAKEKRTRSSNDELREADTHSC